MRLQIFLKQLRQSPKVTTWVLINTPLLAFGVRVLSHPMFAVNLLIENLMVDYWWILNSLILHILVLAFVYEFIAFFSRWDRILVTFFYKKILFLRDVLFYSLFLVVFPVVQDASSKAKEIFGKTVRACYGTLSTCLIFVWVAIKFFICSRYCDEYLYQDHGWRWGQRSSCSSLYKHGWHYQGLWLCCSGTL